MAEQQVLQVPLRFRRVGPIRPEEEFVRVGVWQIEHMCQHLGIAHLGDTEVLDVGCGVRLTQAFINHSLPIRRYVGVDVNRDMIEFLRQNVADPRFEYHHIDVRNDMYNRRGKPLGEMTELPFGPRRFDLICLFSVFTHLAPDDYVNMLRLLRKHVKPDGRLFFSLYIDELTKDGHGLLDGLARKLGPSVAGKVETFQDRRPKHPLKWALYSERYARELIRGTGWTALTLSQPHRHIQHHFLCAPES
jgi:SAM-dependent methyltransferase